MTPKKADFIRPVDLFKMRRDPTPKSALISVESPLKCLNNSNPSPAKNIPILLKNPFNRPVKRKLDLGFSPNKKSRMLDIDEDANLEPPEMRVKLTKCQNDWTLRTKIKINFDKQCKNWVEYSSSTHRRISAGIIEESPCKAGDKSISIEAIKNAATVYQHPYLSWQPLYPRIPSEKGQNREKNPLRMSGVTGIAEMMYQDWCESFNDLVNLFIRGKCPFFYVHSETCNILFKSTPGSNPRRPKVEAFISPFSYCMGLSMKKCGVEFECCDDISQQKETSNLIADKDNSQRSFGSSQAAASVQGDVSCSQGGLKFQEGSKFTPTNDSGNASDSYLEVGEDEDEEEFLRRRDANEPDVSTTFDELGITQQELVLAKKRKGFDAEGSKNKIVQRKPLASIEGIENIKKFAELLQSGTTFTIQGTGAFKNIPPTLLSPREFRLSTPQYPEVLLSKNMIDQNQAPDGGMYFKTSIYVTPKKTELAEENGVHNEMIGPTFVELRGTILPSIYNQLHKLLTTSENIHNHSCKFTNLESSASFEAIPYTSN